MTLPPGGGLVVVDKPSGWTSHDVVGKVRRLAGTKRVGHAGTLDPMATGVLVLGVERATRLLGFLSGHDKSYAATVRLGVATTTDDAEGEPVASADASGVTAAAVDAVLARLTGEIEQVPPAYSAVKVAGVRSYAAARRGAELELAPRRVHVRSLDREGPVRSAGPYAELDLSVVCSAGTYVRALARDLGAALGVGGHLTALRRTASGPYRIGAALPLDTLIAAADGGRFGEHVLPLAAAAGAAFPRREVDADEARRLGHGVALPATGAKPGPVAVFGPDGALIALVEERDGAARPVCVFTG